MSQASAAFGPFVLDRARETVTRNGEPIAIGHRGFSLLAALLDARGEAASKAALMEAGWPGSIVEEGNLSVQIAALRKALGSRSDGSEWIVTVPRVGYLMVGEAGTDESLRSQRPPSLAVLPFQNLSGDPTQDYFAEGIVDELIAAFSRFRSFTTLGRRSSAPYRNSTVDVRAISKELGVDYLVEGSVRRAGQRLRIVTQLVEGSAGSTLWAKTFEGELGEIFAFQDRITDDIAGVVEPQIRHVEIERSRRQRPSSLAAYDLYLRAVSKLYTFAENENAAALQLLERALEIEPDNASYLAFAFWAIEYRINVGWQPLGPDDRERAVALAKRAVHCAADDAGILARAGFTICLIGREFDAGIAICERALELNPGDFIALLYTGLVHIIGGDLDRAGQLLERAVQLSREDTHEAMGALAYVYCCQARFDEALGLATKSIGLRPSYVPAYWSAIPSLVQLERLAEARDALGKLLDLAPGLTIERFVQRGRLRDDARDAIVRDGLRRAGLPER
jgi:TolB-like protein